MDQKTIEKFISLWRDAPDDVRNFIEQCADAIKTATPEVVEPQAAKPVCEIDKVLQGIAEARKELDWWVADVPIENIVNEKKYQPCCAINDVMCSREMTCYVEAILLNWPIQMVYVKDWRGGVFGVDRNYPLIRALRRFVNNEICLKRNGLVNLPFLDGYYFKDLPVSIQRSFLNYTIRTVVINHTVPRDIAASFICGL